MSTGTWSGTVCATSSNGDVHETATAVGATMQQLDLQLDSGIR